LVPVEAAGYGLPVVASDLPVIRECLGARAEYVPVGDVAALTEALRRQLRFSTRPAVEEIRARFAPASVVAAYLEAYAEVLHHNAR
jgi:glycosyltransferase involved in cell wall biosynthesis